MKLFDQRRDDVRDLLRVEDAQLLVPPQFAFLYEHVAFRHFELLGDKLDEMGIGLAINRRCGDGDFYLVAMQANNLIAAGLGLNL